MMTTAPEDRIREIASLPKRTAQPNPDPNPNMAVLDPKQYVMKEVTATDGRKVMVYTGGPLAGQDKDGNLIIGADTTFEEKLAEEEKKRLEEANKPTTFTATDGTVFENESTYNKYEELLGEKKSISDTKRREGESAYNLLYKTFSEYGLGSLVEPLQKYIVDGLSDDEFTLRLRETPAYQKRFGANKQRIAKGLSALDEATYIKMEDKYQDVMRQYGLPASYYEKDSMGTQKGFEDLISNDVSNVELEERLLVAQDRVLKSDPNVLKALKDFYPDIKNGDILAYTLDPKNAIKNIQSKVTAAEIGGAALSQNLTTNLARAEELQKMGVDKAAAVEGYSTIGGGLQRGSELASIYGESPYTQATAESEVFKLTGQTEARKQRQKVTGLEKATFGGQSGVTTGALARDRAGGY
jgi:hypothetical protein